MNYEAIKVWVDVAQFAWMIAATIWAFWGNKHKETHERIGAAETEIGDHSDRLAKVEAHVKHMPRHDDITQVRELISRVGGDVKGVQADVRGVRELIQPMQHTIQLMNEFLLNHNRR